MKKIKMLGVGRILVASIATVFTAFTAFGQGASAREGNASIPEEVFKVLKPACISCHSNEGKDKPKAALNFSTWDQYTSMEKTMLAASIKEEVAEKKMPPKRYLETHPEAAISEDQLNLIVKWCDSLKAKP
jgi:mono/diheme cytochrome c family protein